jgi:hypothetical protein
MSGDNSQRQTGSHDAIRRVLEAEAEVRGKIEACRAELSTVLAAEQARARRVDQRASERVSRLHVWSEERSEAMAAELRDRARAEAPRAKPDAADRERLQKAVDALADHLLGHCSTESSDESSDG